MNCPNCGERMIGDGYRIVLHCPNARMEDFEHSEPDAQPVLCPHIYVSAWIKEKGPVANRPNDR